MIIGQLNKFRKRSQDNTLLTAVMNKHLRDASLQFRDRSIGKAVHDGSTVQLIDPVRAQLNALG
jgi:hypothetical protein